VLSRWQWERMNNRAKRLIVLADTVAEHLGDVTARHHVLFEDGEAGKLWSGFGFRIFSTKHETFIWVRASEEEPYELVFHWKGVAHTLHEGPWVKQLQEIERKTKLAWEAARRAFVDGLIRDDRYAPTTAAAYCSDMCVCEEEA
jgi:hypothetical protein